MGAGVASPACFSRSGNLGRDIERAIVPVGIETPREHRWPAPGPSRRDGLTRAIGLISRKDRPARSGGRWGAGAIEGLTVNSALARNEPTRSGPPRDRARIWCPIDLHDPRPRGLLLPTSGVMRADTQCRGIVAGPTRIDECRRICAGRQAVAALTQPGPPRRPVSRDVRGVPRRRRPAPARFARARARSYRTLRRPKVGCTSGMGGICQVPMTGMLVSRLMITSSTVGTSERIASR